MTWVGFPVCGSITVWTSCWIISPVLGSVSKTISPSGKLFNLKSLKCLTKNWIHGYDKYRKVKSNQPCIQSDKVFDSWIQKRKSFFFHFMNLTINFFVIPMTALLLRFVITWEGFPVVGSITVWIMCCTGSPVIGSGIEIICCPPLVAPITNI